MESARLIVALLVVTTPLFSCQKRSAGKRPVRVYQSQQFSDYWHAGKAEINAYDLNQSRYGENHSGKAVLIFVTEDLSKKLQVKLDDPSSASKINVLKLNFIKKFTTGIYPYSMMLSVFTPVNREKEPATIKASMSSQEWCGQVYTQLNLRNNRYVVKSHSYFEEEADEQFSVRQAVLEDELWNMIRLDHESLPAGKIEVVPGLFFTRLNHVPLKIQSAKAEKSESDSAYTYKITFNDPERELVIRYEKKFPFTILGWEESWKEKGKICRTTARLDKGLYTDYWTKNKNEFRYLRDSLDLPDPF
ncbi:MAG TPA: hypothetical protein VF490_18480 [Chryseosolibacter sp.]